MEESLGGSSLLDDPIASQQRGSRGDPSHTPELAHPTLEFYAIFLFVLVALRERSYLFLRLMTTL